MDLRQLAQERAAALARWEALDQMGIAWNRYASDDRELEIAKKRARAHYMDLESKYQKATSILTTGELEKVEREAQHG